MGIRRWMLAAVIAASVLALPAAADEPPQYSFSPVPPGAVDQNQLVYLAGEAMHSQWRAVTSKKAVGKNAGVTMYQWYLSIYQIDGTVYKLRYRSPDDGGPLSRVTKPNGSQMWFPMQSVQIEGVAELMQPGIEQLVVGSHETGADCGGATVSIFTTDSKLNVVPAASLANSCDLDAKVVHGSGIDSLALTGPYYNQDAPLCCPTKPDARATLSYTGGKWVLTPSFYYKLLVGKLPDL